MKCLSYIDMEPRIEQECTLHSNQGIKLSDNGLVVKFEQLVPVLIFPNFLH